MKFNKEWLRQRIANTEDLEVGAGHYSASLEAIDTCADRNSQSTESRRYLGCLIHQLRRRDRISLSALAEQVRVSQAELRALEEGTMVLMQPRTLHQLAVFFKISPSALVALSPSIGIRDPYLDDAANRFAANSDDLAGLSKQERKKLDEFVSFLSKYKG